MKEERTLRTIHPEIKVIDAKTGTVDYIASDQTLDHYREIILAEGWRFNHFTKNAPFVDSHDYHRIERLLGTVESWKITGKKLVERVRWAIDTKSELAKLGFDLTEKGYLKAVSVGFIPKKWICKNDEGWDDTLKGAGVKREDAAACHCVYLEHEQIELSACIIGANPNALAKAYKAGDLKGEGLKTLGLDSAEGVDFLITAAELCESDECTPLMRKQIALDLRRAFEFANGIPARVKTASSADKSGGADEAKRQTAREGFVSKLAALNKRP